MQFYFIRHAQSENNALWARTGASVGRHFDPPLTEIGERQARVLAEFLKNGSPLVLIGDEKERQGFGLTHLYCSLMTRSVATGAVVARALGLRLHAWQEIHEVGGLYEEDVTSGVKVGQPGPTRAYFAERFPELVLPDGISEAGWWNRPYEEAEIRPERARQFWQALRERHGGTDDRVAIISHGGFYNHLLAAVLNIQEQGYWFMLNNAAMTRLEVTPDHIGLVYLNRFDYLPPELIT